MYSEELILAAEDLEQIETAEAWNEYLEDTQTKAGKDYFENEPWAWAKLLQSLRATKQRRARRQRGGGDER